MVWSKAVQLAGGLEKSLPTIFQCPGRAICSCWIVYSALSNNVTTEILTIGDQLNLNVAKTDTNLLASCFPLLGYY